DQRHLRLEGQQVLKRCSAGMRRVHVQSLLAKQLRQAFCRVDVVVDDKDAKTMVGSDLLRRLVRRQQRSLVDTQFGQLDFKPAAAVLSRAVGADGSAMLRDDVLGNGQAKPQATFAA